MTDPVWRGLADAGGLWGWGDADGIVPWTGEDGRDVVPLWTTAELARAEVGSAADAEEAPVFLDLETLLDEIPDWLDGGVPAAVVSAGDGARTVPLTELTERILRLQVERPD
ncbi:hypothetical protein ACI782_19750 [Geodermatophilus sp. SYSU D00703]